MAVKSVSIRIEEEMLKKISFVADYEGRSVNSHILVLIRNSINQHEEQHGKIEGQVSPDANVKPAKKS
ncbi:MAG: Arc family DNA-binding protein [Defluviitaleaceae bacterium]|nr:Arc family DNA-binding protein [Defluviitaleaceae bacterium]